MKKIYYQKHFSIFFHYSIGISSVDTYEGVVQWKGVLFANVPRPERSGCRPIWYDEEVQQAARQAGARQEEKLQRQ